MDITVKLYGDMKQYAPGDSNQFTLTLELRTELQDVMKQLSIPVSGSVVLVNGRRVDPEYCFQSQDKLVIFPEISGG